MTHAELSNDIADLVLVINSLIGKEDQFIDYPTSIRMASLKSEVAIEESRLVFFLSFLNIFGFITFNDKEEVTVPSKYAAISIAALRRRLQLNYSTVSQLRTEEQKTYYKNFTENLEVIRKQSHNDNHPIHTRNIVNIIIKGKQIRNWRFRDVFLLDYHKSWNQYHLIGLGGRGEKDSNTLIAKTLEKKLDFKPQDYEIDSTINPDAIQYTCISASNGALTQYNIRIFVMKKASLDIQKKVQVNKSIKKGSTPPQFIWATREEINQGEINGIKIMDTSKLVLAKVHPQFIPNIAGTISSYHFSSLISVSSDIQNRVDAKNALLTLSTFIFILGLGFLIPIINSKITTQLIWLSNLADISTILGFILAFIVAIFGGKRSIAE